MNRQTLKSALADAAVQNKLNTLYGEQTGARTERILDLAATFEETYGEGRDISVYSVPGRSELSGNHTDHNHGCVIAASIDLDIIAVAAKRDDGIIRIKSAGFPEDVVDISLYTKPDEKKFGSSESLIAGMCAGFAARAGLPYEEAWRAITKNPAEILGIADRVGTLEVGKDGDVVIWDDDPLTVVAAAAAVTVIDGKVVYRA